MRRGAGLAGVILAATLTASLLWAEAPATSPLPPSRPVSAAPADPDPAAADPTAPAGALPPHPEPRPAAGPTHPADTQPDAEPPPGPGALASSPRPQPRPAALQQAAAAPQQSGAAAAKPGTRGTLCGDSAIKGQVLAPITSRVKGCGVAEPVSVEFVSGVRLNPPATVDCATATALKSWVNKGLQPAFAPRKVVELVTFGSYMCRPRNNVRGARISEHGSGKAIDIGGFVLDNGQTLTVLANYNATIRKAQRAACGPFGTTLGPGSDGYHENHIHLDTASYRNGPYCH